MTILNFHGVGPIVRDIAPGEYACWLDADHFEAILDRVRGSGQIRITVDDGNSSDHAIVLPALLKRGMQAVFFICSGRVGQHTFVDSAQVHDLCCQGMTIGSHGINHKPWRTLGQLELQDEVAGSRKALAELCGEAVDMAACPFGSYDRRVLRTLKNAGYRAVFTSDGGGSEDNQWLRPRTTVKRSFSLADIDLLLIRDSSPARRFLNDARISLKRFRPQFLNVPNKH